jgi:hypothetical protein
LFYQEKQDLALRFGDVIKGFYIATPNIKNPDLSMNKDNYKLDIGISLFYVVMSPCCSIGDKVVSLAPLLHLRQSFFLNPEFKKDFTRINKIVEPEKKFAPEIWKKFSPEKKQQELVDGSTYTVLEVFIYDNHPLLPPYEIYSIKERESIKNINHYMIDFRYSFRTNCDKINSPEQCPLGSKILQLSPQTRRELRHKMSYFYGRIADEDRQFVDE